VTAAISHRISRSSGRLRGGVGGLRLVQLALAAFWVIDALLQLQPSNFTSNLVFGTILGNAENQPQPIFGSLVVASHVLGPYHAELNMAIIVIQLALGAGLLWRPTVKPALAVSIFWALGVWWLGEGFGGIFAGKATLLVGAPGPALLYALLALVAWPRGRPRAGGQARVCGASPWPGQLSRPRRLPGTGTIALSRSGRRRRRERLGDDSIALVRPVGGRPGRLSHSPRSAWLG